MDSPVSAQESEHERGHPPRRLSALYQYHNAPEVAPAHGLEYDDTIYPHSDKMTIVREFPFRYHNYSRKHPFDDNDNRPPRIIFGMKIRTFLVVASIVLLVVIGAAVGGAVGGQNLQDGIPSTRTFRQTTPNPSPTISSTSSTISTFSAATPTYTPLTDCPNANGTEYMSPFSITVSGTNAGNQSFTEYCDLVPSEPAQHIAGTFVYTFSDCVDLCASFNFANDKIACDVAFYEPTAGRPINCQIGATKQALLSTMVAKKGTNVAILIPPL